MCGACSPSGELVRIRWLRIALKNLDDEAAYMAQFDKKAAQRMVARIKDVVTHLGEHPSIARPGRVTGTRELIVAGTPYIVPYRVRENIVEILRVFHSARKWPTSFR